MITIPKALLSTNFILEKGKEELCILFRGMQYTYNLNCCSQFTKDEMQISVLGLYGQAPAGEVRDNPGGEIQSNPCT